ncbi:pre-rRNA-processing factor tsr2 homolog, putative [Babesia ovis]|uniref:Pre-rRNA-processing factor tsr2 homolog, putative n=1 Tax=Babesia ovis TaxID=5869 RepID=A0A9W5TAN8_BABOV|nr:pre-rRNA-processing factor tsr2 homolog, putative [Babesia ovis]
MTDTIAVFRTACRCVMDCWTALNLAVENGWGGDTSAQKKEELIALVTDYCLSKKQLYNDEVEDLLFERMQTLFCVDIEDGSELEIASLLVQLHQSCSSGDIAFARELCQKLTKCDSTQCRVKDNIQEISDSGSDNDTEVLKPSGGRQPKTEQLDDGWTRVL